MHEYILAAASSTVVAGPVCTFVRSQSFACFNETFATPARLGAGKEAWCVFIIITKAWFVSLSALLYTTSTTIVVVLLLSICTSR